MQGNLFQRSSFQTNFQDSFNKRIQTLNAGQLEAVNQIDGPVMVVAGPGTGKTQVLAMRIGNILKLTDMDAHNILCLTFTDAATSAMKDRLLSIIGPDAHRLHIFTFHSFCNQVIQENPSIFGNYRLLEPISELEKIDVYTELINALPAEHILKKPKGDIKYDIRKFDNFFSLLKKEKLSGEQINMLIDSYLEFKETDTSDDDLYYQRKYRDYNAGDKKPHKWADLTFAFDETKAAVELFPEYVKLMELKGRYDYDDMIIWVINAFEMYPNLLLEYQERYQYILVDEYQDTSGSQNFLLSLLISYWEDSPNIFVVGDDDQAIFKFQGANIGNIKSFIDTYKAKVTVLTDNYRSRQNILDISMLLIDQNNERLSKDPKLNIVKNLKSQVPNQDIDPDVQINSFTNISQELAYYADILKKIYNEEKDLSRTAILYRNHRQVTDLTTWLEHENIPITIKRKVNILDLPLIKNIINVLNYLNGEKKSPGSEDWRLFEIMHYIFFDISATDIARISLESYQEKIKDKENNNGFSHTYFLKDRMSDEAFLSRFNIRSKEKIQTLAKLLDKWISDISNSTLQVLFQNIINEGNILNHIIHSPEKIWLLQVLTTIFNHIKEESNRNPSITLEDYLSLINKMYEFDIPLDANQIFQNEKGVQFSTIHSAKGLEYNRVFVIGLTSDVWDASKKSRFSFKIPEQINTEDECTVEDERRLLYVAMTRAKNELVLSFSQQKDEGKKTGQCMFIDELKTRAKLEINEIQISQDIMSSFLLGVMKKPIKKVVLVDPHHVNDVLSNYKLSVTSLNKYLSCPLAFYFETILRVPTARSKYQGFGRAVHHALECILEEHSRGQAISSAMLLTHFDSGMKLNKSHFNTQEYMDMIDYGKQFLPNYYHQRLINIPQKLSYRVEIEVKNAEYNGIPIRGILDKVEIYPDHVIVTDYKTGNYLRNKPKLNPPSEKKPEGGDYWRQIVFYSLLLDSDKRYNWRMSQGVMDFVEPDRKTGEFYMDSVAVSPEDKEIVGKQIADVWAKIQAHEFDQGCEKPECQWCQFVQNEYILPSDIQELEAQEGYEKD